MSRDSRLWQNSLAAGIVFEGDQVEALNWIAWAKGKLGFMLKSTPGATSGTFVPEEGVTIRIDTRPNLIRISVRNTIYMESGFLLLGSTAKCNADTFIPAKIHLDASTNANIAAYLLSSNTPLEGLAELDNTGDYPDFPIWTPPNDAPDAPYFGKGMAHNDPSKTMGGNKLSTFVQDLCGNTYEQVNPTYGDQDMYLQKACQRFVPSSLYSGKLRLFVQALYGSMRTDYKIRLWGDSNLPASYDYNLVLVNEDNSETTFDHGLPTTGLFTTEDYEYFLMECSVSSITFRKLRLSKVAMGWLKVLKTHPLRTVKFFANRVEAYALSTARIDLNKPAITLPTKVPSGAAGGPMGYGFKFKWDGSEIKIILHELNGYAADINISRTVTVKIQYDTTKNEFTLTGQLDNTKTWANDTYHQFWAPDWFNLYSSSFGNKVGGMHNTLDCPMYGYYGSSDQWIEFTISANVTNQTILDNLTGVVYGAENFPGYGTDAPVGLNIDQRNFTDRPFGYTAYSIGGSIVSFDFESNITKAAWRGAYVYGDRGVGYPAGSTPVNAPQEYYTLGPNTLEYGDIVSYLLSNYPRGVGRWGWYDSYPNNGSTGRYDLSWISPGPTSAQVVWGFADDGSAGKLGWASRESFGGYTNITTISLLIPFFDAESIIFGSHRAEDWNSRSEGDVGNTGALRAVFVGYMSIRTGSDGLLYPGTVLTHELVSVKQQITNNLPGWIWNDLRVSEGPNGRTSTKIHQATSGTNGYTFINTGGPITNAILLRQEDKYSEGYPSWAQQFFMKAAPYPDLSDYHPVVLNKSSAGGATRIDMDFGTFSLGYPASGVYSAVGWV